MIRLVAVLIALLAAPAAAQEGYPALFDVAGVAADDVLNIRAAPAPEAEIVGTLSPDATGIEVAAASDDGAWGLVNTGERAGWTALRYLARQPGPAATDAAADLECFGTEPFWSLRLAPGEILAFAAPDLADGAPQPGGYQPVATSASTGKRAFFGWLDSAPLGFTGIVSTGLCSDGMSDRVYGLGIDLIVSDTDGDRLAAGCCRLAP